MSTERIDEALIEAATAALWMERLGRPLLPWQQRVLDRAFIVHDQPAIRATEHTVRTT